jgi:hypothetical protein
MIVQHARIERTAGAMCHECGYHIQVSIRMHVALCWFLRNHSGTYMPMTCMTCLRPTVHAHVGLLCHSLAGTDMPWCNMRGTHQGKSWEFHIYRPNDARSCDAYHVLGGQRGEGSLISQMHVNYRILAFLHPAPRVATPTMPDITENMLCTGSVRRITSIDW